MLHVSELNMLIKLMKTTPKCLLPFQLDDTEDDSNPAGSEQGQEYCRFSNSRHENDVTVELYRQTVPLVQSHSTAAIKTLGAIARDRQLVKRMLHRPPPYAKQLDRRPLTLSSSTSRSSVVPPTVFPLSPSKSASRSNCDRRLAFMAACEKLLVTFDPQVQHTRRIKLAQIQPLLQLHGLDVDSAAFRHWEQRLQPSQLTRTPTVSVSDFIQGCQCWFTETFLIEHVQTLLAQQKHQCDEGKGRTKLLPLQCDYQQSPTRFNQAPYDRLVHESDVTSTFSYETYAHHPPAKAPSLNTSASAPALLHAKYCHCHNLNPATLAAVDKLKTAEQQHRRTKKETAKLARQSKQQSAATTHAFSASVAMISRHVHSKELRKYCKYQLEVQIARADLGRHWSRRHKEHCKAIEQDARAQRNREVSEIKVLAAEDLVLSRDFQALREELVRRKKPLCALNFHKHPRSGTTEKIGCSRLTQHESRLQAI